MATGVGLLAITASLIPSTLIVGVVMDRTGSFRWTLWSGWTVMSLGNGLLILLDEHASPARWILILIVVGLGHGLILQPMVFSVQAMAQPEDAAYAAWMYAFMRTFGQSIGVAIGGTTFQNIFPHRLSDAGLPTTIAREAEGFLVQLKAMPESSEFRIKAIHAHGQAFHGVFGVMLGITVLGLLCSLGIGRYCLDKTQKTQHTLRKE